MRLSLLHFPSIKELIIILLLASIIIFSISTYGRASNSFLSDKLIVNEENKDGTPTTYFHLSRNKLLSLREFIVQSSSEIPFTEFDNIWNSKNNPLKIFLVSTWRSGSTFTAHTLNSHQGVFQHYEPFHYLGVRQLKGGDEETEGQNILLDLAKCTYVNENYFDSMIIKNVEILGQNPQVFTHKCPKEICINKYFLTEACSLFPIQLYKTVRMRLNLTEVFLKEQSSSTKVVFLVRDPRGIMSSRYASVKWCIKNADCYEPSTLCSNMLQDLQTAKEFHKIYPHNFKLVRYEDIASKPFTEFDEIFKFLGLGFTERSKKFLKVHTTVNVNSPSSTSRKSIERTDLWKDKLSKDEINSIQSACHDVLNILEYELI